MAGAPYVPGSPTSRAAAVSVADDLNRLERAVLDRLESAGMAGHTDDELEVLTGMSHQTVSARRRTLVLKNMVMDSGKQRPTRSGRKAVAWVRTGLPGLAVQKAPLKPTSAEGRKALDELRQLYASAETWPSSEVIRLMEWVKWKLR